MALLNGKQYTWDPEKKKYVEVKGANSASSSAATQKTASSPVAKKPVTPLTKERQAVYERANAKAAMADIGNVGSTFSKYQKTVADNLYKRGGSGALGGINKKLGKYGTESALYEKNLRAGAAAIGLSDDDLNKYLQHLSELAPVGDELYALTRARTGDKSVLDGATGDQYKEYERLLNLSGYDQLDAKMQAQLPEQVQKQPASVVDIPADYDFNVFGDDIFRAKYGEEKDGTKLTEEQRQMYKQRIETVTGIKDFDALSTSEQLNLTYDPDYLDQMQKMNSGAQTYQDVLDITQAYGNEDMATDAMTVRDYQEGHVQVSEDEYNRAKNRLSAIGGGFDLESLFGDLDDLDNYVKYAQAYASQARGDAEQAQFDDQIQQKYGQYQNAPDFAAKSQPISLDREPQNDAEAIHEAIVSIDAPELYETPIKEGGMVDTVAGWLGIDRDKFTHTNTLADPNTGRPSAAQQKYNASTIAPDQRKMFKYLWETHGQDAAMQYLEDIDWSVRKAAAAKTEEVSEELSDGVLGGAASSIASVLASPARAVTTPVNAARTAAGQEIDQYDPIFNVGRASDTIRKNVGGNLDELLGNANILGWNIGSGLYNAAMSAASWMLAPFGANGAAAVMGLEASDTAMREALANGRTQGEALRDAGVTAGIEFATGKIPMENLFGEVVSPGKYFLTNALSEMGEELASEGLNMLYDTIAYGDESDLGKVVSELRTLGYAGKDLTLAMVKEVAGRMRDAGFGGLAGGGLGAAGRTVTSAAENASIKKNLSGNDAVKPMLNLAETLNLPEDIRNIVQDQLKAVSDGKNVSAAKIGRIFRETMKAVDEKTQSVLSASMSRNVAGMLRGVGVDDPAIAEAVTRIVADNGTASAEDYRSIATNAAALKMTEDLVSRYDTGMETQRKADEIAEAARGKVEKPAQVNKPPEAEEETEPASETDELTPEEMEAAGIQSDVQIDEQAAKEMVDAAAAEYGRNADIVAAAYETGQDPVSFNQQFRQAYQYGEEGRNLDVISKSSTFSVLNEQQIKKAYLMGRDVRVQRAQEAAKQPVGRVKVGNVDASKLVGLRLDDSQRKAVGAVTALAKAIGFNVEFFASTANADGKFTDKNGSWSKETRTISIDINAGRASTTDVIYAIMQTVGHELTHFIKSFADTELFAQYQDFVMGHLSEKVSEEALDDTIQQYIKRWAENDAVLDRDGAIEEIVADASGDALLKLTEADLQQLAQSNPSLLKKIGDFIQRWVKNTKALIEKAYTGQTARNPIADQMVDAVDELGRKWAELLKNATVNARDTAIQPEFTPKKANKNQPAKAGKFLAYGHIDQRTPESIRNTDTQLFSSEVEEAQGYYAAAANMLLYDAEGSVSGQKFFMEDGVTGQKRMSSDFLSGMKDDTGWSWEKIRSVLQQFAAMAEGGSIKNTVTNREMELYLDEVLSNGYTTLDGTKVAPADDYIEAKNQYQGSANKAAPKSAYDGAVDFMEYAFGGEDDVKFSVRDSVKFSLREPVEQTKNLIAVHNIREDNLRKALDLGGFPMPSIAIAKDDIGHQTFGSISLVFGSDTIDPNANKRNKVYSADAWTPTFPQVQYEADGKVDSRIYKKLNGLKADVDPYFVDDLRRVIYDTEDLLNRHGGEEGLVKYALDNYGMKAAYLEDIGEHAEVVQRMETEQQQYSEMQAEIYTQIAQLVGENNIHKMPMSEIFSKYGDAIEDIYPGSTKSKMRFQRILVNVAGFLKSKDAPPVQKTVTDPAATHETIDQRIDANAFERWVRALYAGIEKASGVYNGKEIFTPSGNRRSFAATHYPATVEGIAKAMYDAHGGNVKNISANHDAKSLRAVTSKNFKSIDEIHKNEGRLKARTQDEADALTASLDKRLSDFASDVLATKPKSRGTYESLIAHDQVVSILQEIAAKKYSAATIKAGYAQYGYSVSDASAQTAKQLLDEISEMPVNIFEAKPERAVYFDEVKYAIVPDTLSADVRSRLEELVPDVREYTEGDEARRLELLNAREDLKFSVRASQTETDEFKRWFKGSKVVNEDGSPKIMYHGTSRFGFDAFDTYGGRYGLMGMGSYFTDNKEVAEGYTKKGRGNSPGIYEVYLSVKNPINMDARAGAKLARAWADYFDEYLLEDSVITGDMTNEQILRVVEEALRYDESMTVSEAAELFDGFYRAQGFDGITHIGGGRYGADNGVRHQVVIAFEPEQVKSATDNIGTFDPEDANIYHQLRDPDQISDRELLSNVMESAATNEAELDFVRRYRTKIDELNKKQAELDATNEAIVNARKEGKKSELGALRSKAEIIGKQLDRLDGKLLTFEAGKPLQAVVKRERAKLREKANERIKKRVEKVRQQEAEKRDELRARIDTLRQEKNQKIEQLRKEKTAAVKKVRDEKNESFARQKYLDEVKNSAGKLREMVTSPTNKKHVPQVLRQPIADFLTTLDFTSAQQLSGGEATKADNQLENAMLKMKDALQKVQNSQNGLDTSGAEYFSGYLDLPAGYAETFDQIIGKVRAAIAASDGINGTPINRMKSADLHVLAIQLRTLHIAINSMNTLIANAKYSSAKAASRDTIAYLYSLKAKKEQNALFQKLSDFIDWKNSVPYYAFQRMGPGGEAIFEALMDGWDKLAFNVEELVKFTESVYNAKEVKAWESEIKTVELESGESVRMTAAQLMSLYCLAKREQAMGHLMGGGIRIADIEAKRGKRIAQGENYILSEGDISKFRDALTDRQREVADALQADMVKRGGDWGNEISMRRFGYDMFTEENYFPVESDRNNMNAKDENATENSLLRLLNMSATKDLTKGANNAIVVRSIFDVYTAHMSDMAKYNALGLQILDLMKWLNYVERTEEVDANGNSTGKITTQSVQKSLELAYGTEARRYIMEFIKNLNGEVEGGREDAFINKFTSNYKIAAVGWNLRVGFLQITSLPRAAVAIDSKYLLAGIAKWNARKGKASAQAVEKVGIAKWKSMGFYDTNISRNMRQMIKHDEAAIDKVRDISMKLAEWGDAWTMGVLYGAVESELMSQGKKPGDPTWDAMVNKRLREIVYRTQVVDSTMTRSHLMRQKGGISGALAFMSEPTLALNMLNDALFESRMNIRAGVKWNPATVKKVAKVFAVSAAVNVLSAFVEAAFTAMRDDDEFETIAEKYLDALWGDYSDAETYGDKLSAFFGSALGGKLNPLSNIPVISDIIDAWKNGAEKTLWQAFAGEMGEGFRAIMKVMREGGTLADYYRAGYKMLSGLSKASGIPANNAVREAASLYNTFAAERMGWRRLQTYDNTESEAAAAILEAKIAGDDEKVKKIRERIAVYQMDDEKIEKSLATRAKDAYLKGLLTKTDADKLMVNEGGMRARDADDALTEADYQIATGLKHSNMKDDFIEGTITEKQARDYLKKYDGLRDDEIGDKINLWKYEKDTGYVYSEMKADFIDGELTESQVKNYRVKYGGSDSDAVEETLGHWKYERDTGLAWSDMEDDYADGVISESQARSYLAKYGGKDEEKVDEKISNFDYHIATGRSTTAPKYWRIAYAFDSGADYGAYIDEAFETIMHGGEKRRSWKEARSQIAFSLASYYKQQYLAARGTAAGDAMLERILDLYEAIGYDRNYERKYIAENWVED